VPPELVIREMRVEEALPVLEKYLDDALLVGYESVRILHGKGTGTLRKVVHEYLRQHPSVASFQLAPREQGGEGVTIVQLR
jgi:DNA mismatch repair protein MutS2